MKSKDVYEERVIALAFFDILGSAKLVSEGNYAKVYDFYTQMIELCAKKEILISHGALPLMDERLKESGWEKETEVAFLKRMRHAFFSDTFIIWIEDIDRFGTRLGGFYEVCSEIFIEALKRRIPLRGAITQGSAIMDEEKKIYIGKPIVEAARLEASQNWLGVSLGLSCGRIYPTEAQYLRYYTKQYKKELLDKPIECEMEIEGEVGKAIIGWGNIASSAALDWPRHWKDTEKGNPIDIISEMNIDPKYSAYYENTIEFIKHSNETPDILKDVEETAPPVVVSVARFIK